MAAAASRGIRRPAYPGAEFELGRHVGECLKHDIPGRVFLDTCVVNFMLDFGAQIHDGAALSPIPPREAADVDALRNLFIVGQRAMWQLAVSPYTYSEIARTRDVARLGHLHMWFQELWQYWRSTIEKTTTCRVSSKRRMYGSACCVRVILADLAKSIVVAPT
jgi:hypothetical protein